MNVPFFPVPQASEILELQSILCFLVFFLVLFLFFVVVVVFLL